mgnify:CR=1 FL=1
MPEITAPGNILQYLPILAPSIIVTLLPIWVPSPISTVIGGGSLIHQFCHIGPHVMLQGGALVNKDIPPYVKAGREPIAYAGVNSIGLRRRGFSNETIRDIQ